MTRTAARSEFNDWTQQARLESPSTAFDQPALLVETDLPFDCFSGIVWNTFSSETISTATCCKHAENLLAFTLLLITRVFEENDFAYRDMMTANVSEHLVFHRQSDALVYRFKVSSQATNDGHIWIREDKASIVVQWTDKWGWIVASIQAPDEPILLSLSWNIHKDDQGDRPPEGEWVSKMGDKSYVYRLNYEKT